MMKSTTKFNPEIINKALEIRVLHAVSNLGMTANNVWDFFEYPDKNFNFSRANPFLFQKDVIDALPNAQPDDYLFYARYFINAFKSSQDTDILYSDRVGFFTFSKIDLLHGLLAIYDDKDLTRNQRYVIERTVEHIDTLLLSSEIRELTPQLKKAIKATLQTSSKKDWKLSNIIRHLEPDEINSIRAWIQSWDQDHAYGSYTLSDRQHMIQIVQDTNTLRKIKDLIFNADGILTPTWLKLLDQLLDEKDVKDIKYTYNTVVQKNPEPLLAEILFALQFLKNKNDSTTSLHHTDENSHPLKTLEKIKTYTRHSKELELLHTVAILSDIMDQPLQQHHIQSVCSILDRITDVNPRNRYSTRNILKFLLHPSSEIRLKTVQKIVAYRSKLPTNLLMAVKKNDNNEWVYGTGLNILNTQSFKRFINCYAPEWREIVNVHEKIYGDLKGVELLIQQQSHLHQKIDALDFDATEQSFEIP